MANKHLPHGNWLTMVNLPVGTTEEDIQGFIHTRTGMELPLDHIQLNDERPGHDTVSAMISLAELQVFELVSWAFGEDKIGGRDVRWLMPMRRRGGGRY